MKSIRAKGYIESGIFAADDLVDAAVRRGDAIQTVDIAEE